MHRSSPDMTVISVPEGIDVVLQPNKRWSKCIALSIWLALVAYALSDNLSRHVGLILVALGLALAACIVWAALVKEFVCLRPQNITMQTVLGPVELDSRVELTRTDIKAVEFRVRHSRGKGWNFVDRKIVLLTSDGEVGLRMQLSQADGEKLRDVFQQYLGVHSN